MTDKKTIEKKPWYKKLKWWHWAIIIAVLTGLLGSNQEQSGAKHTLPILEKEIQNGTISSYKCKSKCDEEVTLYIKDMKEWTVDGIPTYGGYARYIMLQRSEGNRKAYHELDRFTINLMSGSELLGSCNYSDTNGNGVKTINCPDGSERGISGNDQSQNNSNSIGSVEQKIENSIREILKGNNNRGLPYIKDISINSVMNDGFNVFVQFNASDNLSNKMIKGGIEGDMTDIYLELSKYKNNIAYIEVGAYFPLMDKYGNESNTLIYHTSLDKETFSKINRSQNKTTLKHNILPKNWKVLLVSPVLK